MYIGTFYGMHFNVYWTIYVFRIFEPYHCWVISPTAKGWARCWWQSLHVLLAKFSRDDWNMWALGKPLENEIFDGIPSGKHTKSYWKWSFIVDFPIKIVIFHSYVSLPEGHLYLLSTMCYETTQFQHVLFWQKLLPTGGPDHWAVCPHFRASLET